jgi:hypothetical protein
MQILGVERPTGIAVIAASTAFALLTRVQGAFALLTRVQGAFALLTRVQGADWNALCRGWEQSGGRVKERKHIQANV